MSTKWPPEAKDAPYKGDSNRMKEAIHESLIRMHPSKTVEQLQKLYNAGFIEKPHMHTILTDSAGTDLNVNEDGTLSTTTGSSITLDDIKDAADELKKGILPPEREPQKWEDNLCRLGESLGIYRQPDESMQDWKNRIVEVFTKSQQRESLRDKETPNREADEFWKELETI